MKHFIILDIYECKSTTNIWTTLNDLYEIKNTNHLLFLKSKILSIKMEENESVVVFISHIKELKNKLGDIGEIVSDTDLVMITMNGMSDNYQMFITGLNAREKPPKFQELSGILMQEEERWMTMKPQSLDLALMVKKKPFRGKENVAHKSGGTPQIKPPPSQGVYSNRNDLGPKCFYCGRVSHIAKNLPKGEV